MTVQGRWNIHITRSGGLAVGPRRGESPAVPVVPCDDAAIERAVEELIGASFGWRTYSPAQVVDVVARALAGQSSEEIAEAYFSAAGETP